MSGSRSAGIMMRVGTAGWNVPRAYAAEVDVEGSHLHRYACVLNCVEINSTFYRLPRASTVARWAACSPEEFRFAVKAPKAITHEKKLESCGAELADFFAALQPMQAKLGPVLVQLPPKLAFEEGTAHEFLSTLRELHSGPVAVEPRHTSWFTAGVDQLLRSFEVARVMADPPKGSLLACKPGGWSQFRYYRLHGSPQTYWTAYPDSYLQELAHTLLAEQRDAWVVFDNTAQGHAFGNARTLANLVEPSVKS